MRRGTRTLWILYGGLALAVLAAALLAAAAIGLAMAIPHTAWLLDEYRHLLHRADADNRALARAEATGRPALTTRQDMQVRKILAADCCETWWATAGAQHDPEHCTRKDQTT